MPCLPIPSGCVALRRTASRCVGYRQVRLTELSDCVGVSLMPSESVVTWLVTDFRQTDQPATRHGITGLAFASPGRLRGHLADDRDLFDMFEFQRAATDLLGAEIALYSDGTLRNDHVSPDLATASPL
jgi:hypothetical protein